MPYKSGIRLTELGSNSYFSKIFLIGSLIVVLPNLKQFRHLGLSVQTISSKGLVSI